MIRYDNLFEIRPVYVTRYSKRYLNTRNQFDMYSFVSQS